MSAQGELNNDAHNTPEDEHRSLSHEPHHGLEAESFTAHKLRLASAHHLHLTSRRFFIGPIPEGWLNNHRKSWYKRRLRLKNYSSRTVSFAVDPVVAHYQRRSESDSPQHTHQQADGADDTVAEEEGVSDTSEQEADQESSQTLRNLPLPSAVEDEEDTVSESSNDSSPDSRMYPVTSTPSTRGAASSYFTARETSKDVDSASAASPEPPKSQSDGLKPPPSQHVPRVSSRPDKDHRLSPIGTASESGSYTPLLRAKRHPNAKSQNVTFSTTDTETQGRPSNATRDQPSEIEQRSMTPNAAKVARFNLDDRLLHKQQRLRDRINRTQDNISSNLPYRREAQEGEIVKAEKMLVRVEETMHKQLPEDYTENDSFKMETRVVDQWREYLVVCRRSSEEHTPFALQMYKTRVIPEVQKEGSKKAPYYEVSLNQKNTRTNLYSSLDKTLVIWQPCKRGTKIFIIRPKSAAHSVEWYTFIRQSLGWRRPSSLLINVPDLGVTLIFNNPFEQLDKALSDSANGAERNDGVLAKSAFGEKYAAAAIIRGCMKMLEDQPEWEEVLKEWSKTERMGLAWKRYDRLEWVYGVNEEKMYGSIAMQTSHDLELRPRHHYPTSIKHDDQNAEEPPPVEGFLIRLTSQKGVHQRYHKMFYKRLYFFTQDNYLMFCRPAKALPPVPPKVRARNDADVPTADEILQDIPLSYEIDPYPVEGDEVAWLLSGNKEYVKQHDKDAYASYQRNIHNLCESDGYLDLCRISEVREVKRGSVPADRNLDEGPDVDFHPEARDSRQEDGDTKQFDDDRTFELLLDTGLVVRLQAYNIETRNEWLRRLRVLVRYWKSRKAADATEVRAIRQHNQELLDIDEEMESILGQFGKKWEVKKSVASPHLHNMCLLSGCRTVRMSGQLYRKPRRHSTFKRYEVMLTAGKLLVFRSSLRKMSGVEIPSIHQELDTTIDLQDCYIYSGLLTDSDLLYANQTFDSNHPGHHALPRIYLSPEVCTSYDEDVATTFVIWRPKRRNYFRAQEAGEKGQTIRKLRHVSALGAHGRSIVFKARTRVERDRWVLAIAAEIDRLQEEQQEDIRIVGPQ